MAKKIAIVGSGVSGLAALYALKDSGHHVHLFESADRLGGHTNTVDFEHNGEKIPVDTGFIVMNTATYPNFISFLKHVGVKTVLTDMTFGISRDRGAFEWSGTSPNSLFAQRRNLLRPSFWLMLFDIIRFNQFALDLLAQADNDTVPATLSIGEYLDREGYSHAFRHDYLLPMTACIWSTGADKCALDFPAVTLVRFLWNHNLLNTVSARAPWLTIPGGSRQYISAILAAFPTANIHLSMPVQSLANGPDNKVVVLLGDNSHQTFDSVILACHAPQALSILSTSATESERAILSAFTTTPNTVYLHSDTSLMPKRHLTWSSWNYLCTTPAAHDVAASPTQKVTLTYNMNILQHLPAPTPPPPHHTHPVSPSAPHILVTMNPVHAPSPPLTQHTISYAHPLYTAAAIAAQTRLPDIQGARGVYYAGAWTGFGFHEDGFRSGVQVALRRELGGSVAWEVVDAREGKKGGGRLPVFGVADRLVRAVVIVVLMALRVAAWAVAVAGRTSGEVPSWVAAPRREGEGKKTQ